MHPLDFAALKEWFMENKREFPWRKDPTPYAVWISEVMLQQTRAAVVIGYFERWMQKFPTIDALASASEQEVIKIWEGLGYYSRARNLRLSAQYLVERHSSLLPSNREDLEKIKGLGPYTVGAILSFAFKQKAAAVDGNVLRVLSRYFFIEEDIQKSGVQKRMREMAESLLPSSEPWIVMEALIELGATLCTREPKCCECPLREGCQGYRNGAAASLPVKGKKTQYLPLKRVAFVIKKEKKVLLKKAKEGKVMAGLYEFPYLEFTGAKKSSSFLEQHLFNVLKLKASYRGRLTPVKHFFTRYKVELFPTIFEALEEEAVEEGCWIEISDAKNLPFSSGHRRILQKIEEIK